MCDSARVERRGQLRRLDREKKLSMRRNRLTFFFVGCIRVTNREGSRRKCRECEGEDGEGFVRVNWRVSGVTSDDGDFEGELKA